MATTLSTSSSLCSSRLFVNASSFAVPLRARFGHRLPSTNYIFFSLHHPHRSCLLLSSNRYAKSALRSASVRPPPDSDPRPEQDSVRLTGFPAFFSKFQDRVQVFFAVLFWMSLFFWTSVWDGNDRPNKGSRFRR